MSEDILFAGFIRKIPFLHVTKMQEGNLYPEQSWNQGVDKEVGCSTHRGTEGNSL
jgi:hypothetical protein